MGISTPGTERHLEKDLHMHGQLTTDKDANVIQWAQQHTFL
jgi:hypothetical protein